jgi:hypothetical protein
MEPWQWFTMGLMTAIIPSLIMLAILLYQKGKDNDDE